MSVKALSITHKHYMTSEHLLIDISCKDCNVFFFLVLLSLEHPRVVKGGSKVQDTLFYFSDVACNRSSMTPIEFMFYTIGVFNKYELSKGLKIQ